MGATFKGADSTGGQKSYEIMDGGVYPGRCIRVVEVGTQTKTFNNEPKEIIELVITWETNELMEDGRPFIVSWKGTNSLNNKAKLYKLLSDWRGKPFTPDEAKAFQVSNILDKPCLLNVVQEEWKDRDGNIRVSNHVASVMPLPKGMNCNERHNDLLDFGCPQDIPLLWNKLYPSEKKLLRKSKEYKNLYGEAENPPTIADESQAPPADKDGVEPPF